MSYISDLPLRSSYPFDEETVIRDIDATALTATTTETALSGFLGYDFKVVLDVAAFTGYSAGTALWTLEIEVSADNSTFYPVRTYALTGTAQRIETSIAREECTKAVSGARYVTVTATKTGSPGALSYGAFIPGC